ncbi:hypothetical protein EK21DRAFT_108645 [Setomelanomma holmii]|uniref:Uncharacterized protein n=1 Tax=Setomelanomma holmii TaxID=210430 RepID=A0A9P4LR23_9PLEO|nr:hypothetical protein EK21DRAFT_108645 [Setomelanomma holmii]
MWSTSSTASRTSSTTSPPRYDSLDLPPRPTSKTFMEKVFHRKSSDSSSSTSSSSATIRAARDREYAEKEARHAARASYFSTM